MCKCEGCQPADDRSHVKFSACWSLALECDSQALLLCPSNAQYIVSGSDDGSFFIWEKETTNLVRVLQGDESIVNCLQPHPSYCFLATSGIDPVVRLWNPRPEVRAAAGASLFAAAFSRWDLPPQQQEQPLLGPECSPLVFCRARPSTAAWSWTWKVLPKPTSGG